MPVEIGVVMMNERLVEQVETKKEETPEEKPVKVKNVVKGKVIDCEKLNVRRHASLEADIIAVIDKDDVVVVNDNGSTEEWYMVITKDRTKGFCMKKYITVERP